MLHHFRGNKCIFCGVSLAVSGYSEACPARANEGTPRMRVQRQDSPPVLSAFPRPPLGPSSNPNTVICYRCGNSIIPRIVQQNVVRGAVDMPLPGHHHMLMPIQGVQYSAECPMCGAPLRDAEADKLNAAKTQEDTEGFWLGLGILAVVGLGVALLLFIVGK